MGGAFRKRQTYSLVFFMHGFQHFPTAFLVLVIERRFFWIERAVLHAAQI